MAASPKRTRKRSTSPGKGARRRRVREKEAESFYATALDEAERLLLERAREMEGLDEEIALLRTRLSTELERRPEDTAILVKLVDRLVKAVATRYRVSKDKEEDLLHSVVGVLEGIGDALGLEGVEGVPGADESD